jgi:hypothetical protein
MEVIETWLSSQAAEFFDTGMQKRTPQYDKYLFQVMGGLYRRLIYYLYYYIPTCFGRTTIIKQKYINS